MNLTGLWEFIGRASNWVFIHVVEKISTLPNYTFIIIGFLTFFIWMKKMSDYNKEAEESGKLK